MQLIEKHTNDQVKFTTKNVDMGMKNKLLHDS